MVLVSYFVKIVTKFVSGFLAVDYAEGYKDTPRLLLEAPLAGTNPYIDVPQAPKPTLAYTLILKMDGEVHTLQVNPNQIPYGRSGQPGSILDICEGFDLPLEHTCGGVCACSTCHVIVRDGLSSCNEANDDELDQLEEAPGLTLSSRLGCQCVPNGSMGTVTVEVPNWNRNAVKETPH